MKTNITEICKKFKEAMTQGIYKDLNTKVILNSKKIKKGMAAISFYIKITDKPITLTATLYIIERKKDINVLFVNDNTHDIVFTNNTEDAVAKSIAYINTYLYRCTCKMLNIPIDEEESKAEDK